MKHWKDLTPVEQKDYDKGVVELNGFPWDCYYKHISDDLIEMYCEDTGYTAPSYTHYKSLLSWGCYET